MALQWKAHWWLDSGCYIALDLVLVDETTDHFKEASQVFTCCCSVADELYCRTFHSKWQTIQSRGTWSCTFVNTFLIIVFLTMFTVLSQSWLTLHLQKLHPETIFFVYQTSNPPLHPQGSCCVTCFSRCEELHQVKGQGGPAFSGFFS